MNSCRHGSWASLIARVLGPIVGLLLATAPVAQAQDTAPTATPQYSASPAAKGLLDAVRGWLGGGSPEPDLLPPDQAYQLSVRARDATTLVATLTPAKDYYLYRDRIKFSVEAPAGLAVASVTLPPGDFKEDPTFGKTEVYHRAVEAVIRLAPADTRSDSIRLHASYQGCNEPRGVCYPPIEKTLTIALAGGGSSAAGLAIDAAIPAAAAGPSPERREDASEPGRIRQLFTRGGLWALVAAFFGFGVLLAFTPCMLPMIPILSGIIVGQG